MIPEGMSGAIMKRTISTVLLITTIVGCSTTPAPLALRDGWMATVSTDDFTDERQCRVTWAHRDRLGPWRRVFALYPVAVFEAGKAPIIGVESVAASGLTTVRIPVGNVQLRVDSGETHDLTAFDIATYQAKIASGATADATAEMEKAMAPVTYATEFQSEAILKDLLTGLTVRIRQIAANTPGETGEFPLAGFGDAVAKCEEALK